jgi:hypothetical protein
MWYWYGLSFYYAYCGLRNFNIKFVPCLWYTAFNVFIVSINIRSNVMLVQATGLPIQAPKHELWFNLDALYMRVFLYKSVFYRDDKKIPSRSLNGEVNCMCNAVSEQVEFCTTSPSEIYVPISRLNDLSKLSSHFFLLSVYIPNKCLTIPAR